MKTDVSELASNHFDQAVEAYNQWVAMSDDKRIFSNRSVEAPLERLAARVLGSYDSAVEAFDYLSRFPDSRFKIRALGLAYVHAATQDLRELAIEEIQEVDIPEAQRSEYQLLYHHYQGGERVVRAIGKISDVNQRSRGLVYVTCSLWSTRHPTEAVGLMDDIPDPLVSIDGLKILAEHALGEDMNQEAFRRIIAKSDELATRDVVKYLSQHGRLDVKDMAAAYLEAHPNDG